MNQQVKNFLFLLIMLMSNAHAMHDEETAGPSEQTAETTNKKRRHWKQQNLAQKEEEIEEESARFGATQPVSESDSPEGFLHGESN